MTIRETLNSLSKQDQATLNYAFEHGIAYFIQLSEGRFVGVNVQGIRKLVPEQSAGVWSVGYVKQLAEIR